MTPDSPSLAPLRACLSPGCWHPAITPTQQRASAALSGYTEAEHDRAMEKLVKDLKAGGWAKGWHALNAIGKPPPADCTRVHKEQTK